MFEFRICELSIVKLVIVGVKSGERLFNMLFILPELFRVILIRRDIIKSFGYFIINFKWSCEYILVLFYNMKFFRGVFLGFSLLVRKFWTVD